MTLWAATIKIRWLRRTVWVATAMLTLAATGSAQPRSAVDHPSGSARPVTTTASTPKTPRAAAITSAPRRATTTSTFPRTTTIVSPSTTATSAAPPATSTAPADGSQPALDVLAMVAVEPEHQNGYARELFKTWIGVAPDGCDARTAVLRRESTTPIDPALGPCSTTGGAWVSPYDEAAISDPGNSEIDHVVSLKEAWDSGAWAWTDEQRTAYGNDTTDARTLRVVSPSANRSKGDKDPSNWLPVRAEYVCRYVADWLAIKARWSLTMDESEAGRIRNLLKTQCADATFAPWPAAAASVENLQPPTAETTPASPAPNLLVAPPAASPRASTAAPSPPATRAPGDIKPGAFCSDEGAFGSYNGKSYVCSRTSANGSSYAGDKPHWRPA